MSVERDLESLLSLVCHKYNQNDFGDWALAWIEERGDARSIDAAEVALAHARYTTNAPEYVERAIMAALLLGKANYEAGQAFKLLAKLKGGAA
jgi:hypothetical protein